MLSFFKVFCGELDGSSLQIPVQTRSFEFGRNCASIFTSSIVHSKTKAIRTWEKMHICRQSTNEFVFCADARLRYSRTTGSPVTPSPSSPPSFFATPSAAATRPASHGWRSDGNGYPGRQRRHPSSAPASRRRATAASATARSVWRFRPVPRFGWGQHAARWTQPVSEPIHSDKQWCWSFSTTVYTYTQIHAKHSTSYLFLYIFVWWWYGVSQYLFIL